MIIVGFAGKARTGKTHVCQTLYDMAHDAGWDVKIKPFAGPLKHHVINELGFPKETHPEEYRLNCQLVGAARREENPDHWTNLWLADMKREFKEEMDKADRPCLYLVDDVRYANELKLLGDCDAVSIFVKHGDRKIDDPSGEWRNHESETMANLAEKSSNDVLHNLGFDYVLSNDGSSIDLTKWAEVFVTSVLITHKSEACECEGCLAALENRMPDTKKVDQELEDMLNEIRDALEEEDDDDNDADDSDT
jgi:hypothetical protein